MLQDAEMLGPECTSREAAALFHRCTGNMPSLAHLHPSNMRDELSFDEVIIPPRPPHPLGGRCLGHVLSSPRLAHLAPCFHPSSLALLRVRPYGLYPLHCGCAHGWLIPPPSLPPTASQLVELMVRMALKHRGRKMLVGSAELARSALLQLVHEFLLE